MPSGPDLRALGRTAGPLLGAGLLIVLLATTWSGLWRSAPSGTLAIVCVLAATPAIVRVSGLRRAGLWSALTAVVAALALLAAAVHASPFALLSADDETWSRLGDVIPDGLGNASTTPLPLAVENTAALSALLVLVLAGAASQIAWQGIVSRRPLAAVIAAATGLAYRWTLVPPRYVIFTGVLTLVVALLAFRLCGQGRSRRSMPARAVAAGALVTALAVVASVGVDRAPASWWDWRDWTFGAKSRTTSLSLQQKYGPLSYPDEPALIARVAAEEPIPLRAVTLEDFDGLAFVQSAEQVSEETVRGGLELPRDPRGEPRRVQQQITLGSTRSPWLLAGGRPVEVRGLGRRSVTRFSDGSVRLQPSLTPESKYELEVDVPDPGVAALRRAVTYGEIDPRWVTLSPGGGAPPVTVPVWGTGPVADPSAFGQYQGVYELSREIIGDATTPYDAVNRVEIAVRRNRYDVEVERPVGTPDLVHFLLKSKTGYCQHFAGAMALMLRMNGIPARVAVGFTMDSGRFDRDKETQEIIDRDAHSWVEVYFEGQGWIPFDPTPGRAVPNRASFSSPAYDRAEVNIDTETGGASDPAPPEPKPEPPPPAAGGDTPDGGTAPDGSTPWWLAFPLGAAALVGAPAMFKLVRRRRRRRGDERMGVLGAAREWESFLVDLGSPSDPAATPAERSASVWRALGVDAGQIYGPASAARFSPSQPPRGTAAQTWNAVAAAKATVGWRRRALAGLRLRSLRA